MPLPSRPKTSLRPPRVEQPILRAQTLDSTNDVTEPTTNEHTTADTQGEVLLAPVIVRPSAMIIAPAMVDGVSGTDVVESLSVTAPRMPRYRSNRSLWILVASLLAAAGSFALVMLTPGIEIGSAAAEAIEPATSAMPTTMHDDDEVVTVDHVAPPVDAGVDASAVQLVVPIIDAKPTPVAQPKPDVDMKLDEPPAKPEPKTGKRPVKKLPAKKR